MSTISPNKGYTLPATGDFPGTWGVQLDTNVFSIVDLNLGGRLAKAVTVADVTLTTAEARNVYVGLTGVLTGNRVLNFPATSGGFYIVNNACTGAFTITAKPTGGTGVVLPQGQVSFIFVNPDATTAVFAAPAASAAGGAIPISGGGTGQITAAAAFAALTPQALGTGDSPQFAGVNVGAATDTTIARASAGNINIEGNLVYRAGGTDVPVADGGTGSSTASGARTNLGLGTAAVVDTGTSGATIPLLSSTVVWSGGQTIRVAAGVPLLLDRTGASGGDTSLLFRADNVTVGSVAYVDAGGPPTIDGVAYNTTSDGRLKNVLGPIEDSGEIIDALEMVYFAWKYDPDQTPQPGWVAQDAYAVSRTLATPGRGEPGHEGFEPWQAEKAAPMAYVVAELKALRRRVAELEASATRATAR